MRGALLLLLCLVAAASAEDVQAKGLVKDRITAKTILAHARQADESSAGLKHFHGPTLAYVTPWNSAGYENAKRFAAKFTYISPVWYRLERKVGSIHTAVELVGRHDVDKEWIAAVHSSAKPSPLIVPRVYVEPSERVTDVEWMMVVGDILTECSEHGFDGIVLDVGFAAVRAFQENRLGFLHHMATELHSRSFKFLLSIPPYSNMFSAENFEALSAEIDGFSLMSYDYHHVNSDNGGPISPHWWAMQSVLNILSPQLRSSPLRSKILLGANLYGYEYLPGAAPRALTGNDFLKVLERYKATARFEWEQEAHEHRLTYRLSDGKAATLYYPTLLSLSDRIQLADSLGIGLSLWEIGQPLPYFFDLL